MSFRVLKAFPNVLHIQDEMGTCMTLLLGTKSALLLDTGYGLTNVRAQMQQYTHLPLFVVLTHGHHDHALGARWFQHVRLFPQDFTCYVQYTAPASQARVQAQARAKGLNVDFGAFPPRAPVQALQAGWLDLGNFAVYMSPCPGHTPGSAVAYVPRYKLLITGDSWNPCTWLFFPEALNIWQYRQSIRRLLSFPFEWVLCSHQHKLFPRACLEAFVQGLTDACITHAPRIRMQGWDTLTPLRATPASGQEIIFDGQKAQSLRLGL